MAKRKYKFGPTQLPCGEGARLVIAFDDGWWDVAYYRLPEGESFEERFAIRKRVLLDGIRVLFAEADEPFDADGVIDYIERQPWSHSLKQVGREIDLEDPRYDPSKAEIPY